MVKSRQRWMYTSSAHKFILEVLSVDGSVEGKVIQVFYGSNRYVGETGRDWSLRADSEVLCRDWSNNTWILLEGQEAPV